MSRLDQPKIGPDAVEVIHIHQTLVLHFNGAAGVGIEARFDVLPGRFGDADATRIAGGFDALGYIHGIPPDIVGKFVFPDDAGNDWSGIDSNPHLPRRQVQLLALPIDPGQMIDDLKRSQRGIDGVRAIGLRHAANGEIGISDRLEFFEAMIGHDVVEPGEVLVELVNDARRLHGLDQSGEPGEVDQHHRRGVEEARLNPVICFEFGRDGWRQDVQEQLVRFGFPGHCVVRARSNSRSISLRTSNCRRNSR